LTSDSHVWGATKACGGVNLLLTGHDPHHSGYIGNTFEQSWPCPEETLPPVIPCSKTVLSYFDAHSYECRYYKRSQISGVRFKYIDSACSYNVCDDCYSQLEPRKKLKCHRLVMAWISDVPAAPLSKDHDSMSHLQYLLVKFGYLELSSATSLLKMEEAVARFRQQYKIVSQDMTKYDIRTARKLAQIVRKYRAEGHKYI